MGTVPQTHKAILLYILFLLKTSFATFNIVSRFILRVKRQWDDPIVSFQEAQW